MGGGGVVAMTMGQKRMKICKGEEKVGEEER